jgi:hypothetical protein
MKKNTMNTVICSMNLTSSDISLFKELIDGNYSHNWLFGSIHADSFPIGNHSTHGYHVYQHFNITIQFTDVTNNKTFQIHNVMVTPLTDRFNATRPLDEQNELELSYSVQWIVFQEDSPHLHWFLLLLWRCAYLIVSATLFLMIVVYIFVIHEERSLTFFYLTDPENFVPLSDEQLIERLCPTEILTPSSTMFPQILCTLVSTGSLLLLCGVLFLFCGSFTGDTMNSSIIERLVSLYLWTSPVNGFLAVFLDKLVFQQKSWFCVSVWTAIIYPLIVLLSGYLSGQFYSTPQYDLALCLWLEKILPLTLVGGYISSLVPAELPLKSPPKTIIHTRSIADRSDITVLGFLWVSTFLVVLFGLGPRLCGVFVPMQWHGTHDEYRYEGIAMAELVGLLRFVLHYFFLSMIFNFHGYIEAENSSWPWKSFIYGGTPVLALFLIWLLISLRKVPKNPTTGFGYLYLMNLSLVVFLAFGELSMRPFIYDSKQIPFRRRSWLLCMLYTEL